MGGLSGELQVISSHICYLQTHTSVSGKQSSGLVWQRLNLHCHCNMGTHFFGLVHATWANSPLGWSMQHGQTAFGLAHACPRHIQDKNQWHCEEADPPTVHASRTSHTPAMVQASSASNTQGWSKQDGQRSHEVAGESKALTYCTLAGMLGPVELPNRTTSFTQIHIRT